MASRGRGRGRRTPPKRATRASDPVPFIREQRRATRYTARWHRVRDWAFYLTGMMDVLPARQPGNERITLHRAALVFDLSDDEEAYRRGLGLETMDDFPHGPTREEGGRRRVVIRAFTWIPDDRGEVAYAPQWIVLGTGQTARSASASAARYVRAYASAFARGIESRRLLVTAMEVLWWTTSERAGHV